CYDLSLVLIYVVFFFSSRRRHTRLVSDWSSDVCSSDLSHHHRRVGVGLERYLAAPAQAFVGGDDDWRLRILEAAGKRIGREAAEIGRASCRERGEVSGGAV